MSPIIVTLVSLLLINNCAAEGRWSRQLSPAVAEDWIPVDPHPIDNIKQASARVLSQPVPFQSSFFPGQSSNEYKPQESPRQLFLQSVPSAQPGFPPQPIQLTLTDPRYPFAQAFVPRSNLQYQPQEQSFPQFEQPLAPQFVQHPTQINNQFYNQMKTPQFLQPQKPLKPEVRLVDGYRVENASTDYFQSAAKKKPTNLIKKQEFIKPETSPLPRVTERSSTTLLPAPTMPTGTTVEKEEVQLLYVPLETLHQDAKKYFQNAQKQKESLIRDSIGSPGQINNQLYTPTTPNYVQRQQTQLHNIQQDLIQQAFNTQNLQSQFQQNPFDRQTKYQPSSSNVFPFTQTYFPKPDITTPKSKKLKAHQPPLAIYMINKSQDNIKLTDVLNTLKTAKGISVLDNIGPNSPEVFVGPSNLRAPEYYSKFELPYLSSIDGNRIQRNIDRLPFFVAPLSYKAPLGFAKIPFPAPHVGSVIINPFMNEAQDTRTSPLADVSPSSFAYTTFQHNPSTESFRSTVTGSSPIRQNNVNYFPSATPNPSLGQTTIPAQFSSSFLPFDSFGSHRTPSSTKRPETTILTTSRRPSPTYLSTTPPKPTISYFSFSGPDYSTISTTPRPSSTPNYIYRGHYITNAAADSPPNPMKVVTPPKDVFSEKPQTTPLPPPAPTLPSENPYLINHIIQQTTQDEVKNFKTNEIQEYNTEKQSERPVLSTFSTFIPDQRPGFVENIRFSPVDTYSPNPYFGPTSSVRPNEIDITSDGEEHHQIHEEIQKETATPVQQQYQFPTGDDDDSNIQYHTEIPTTQEIITTTTTTTTTPAPTTKTVITRRPIHLRGRPRTTTPKPDVNDQATKPTTRRTPLRERRPSTFRSRFTTTEASPTESSNFETKKTRTESTETTRPTRYNFNRNRGTSDDETKSTTESSLPKTSAAARNQRLRSRGKTHFKPTDNYEGSDYVAKKSKTKDNKAEEDIAYQRDVLHQNYPVTLNERISTLEMHTTPLPPSSQGIDLTNGKIRIYETTGSTHRTFALRDPKPSEATDIYDNQPVFEGEEQKYLTQPEPYDVSSERTGSSSIMPELFINSRDSSTVNENPSTSENYDKVYETTAREQIRHSDVIESERESVTQYLEETTDKYELPASEAPIARFRNKIRSRPKHIAVTVSKNDESENVPNSINIVNKKVEENQGQTTRRASLQPVTYRPAFNRHQTTMKIEEIEAELKSNRHQLRTSLNPTTSKHPVYIPESSSTSEPDNIDPTTKRTHFVRRRPVRPTTTPATPHQRGVRPTTESSVVENTTPRRVRVRGRIRTRPTTTTTEKTEEIVNEEEIQKADLSDDKYSKTTERTSAQKYSTRGRLSTQKYFKRPVAATERIPSSQESLDDQASYDSINRPEYVEFKTNDKTNGDYNPENGKAETQWSPKLTQSSFRPIFNPNLIADEIKQDGIEYGTKLSTNDGDDEIITARNPYEDVLISVTPSSNTIDLDKTSVYENIYPSTTFRIPNINEDEEMYKKGDTSSTFESVLEEVMRNLEQQDEDEYNGPIMKHEGGEIGAIPPENEHTTRRAHDFSDLMDFSSTAVDNKYTTTTTERQGRRRGVWRKIKVRPVQKKNVFEAAESQYYGSSNNDLLKIKDTVKDATSIKNKELKKEVNKIVKEEPERVEITTEYIKDETTITPTVVPEIETVTEIQNIADMDLGTGSPDILLMNMFSDTKKDVNTNKTDYLLGSTPKVVEENKSTISNSEIENVKFDFNDEESIMDEDSKDDTVVTTTEMPFENPTEYTTETQEETTTHLELNENTQVNEPLNNNINKVVNRVEAIESTTSAPNYWDPMNVITSKSTEISHETEICYRGRCIKTKKTLP